MCNKNEFDQIMQKLQEYVLKIINENPNAQFFICSEDENWKNIISQWIITQKGNIVTLNIPPNMYNNIPGFFAITDLFALSRCKEIIQGVKHSSFSLLASLINPNGKIVNFASPEDTLLQYWTYVVNTNHPLQALQQLFTKMNKFKTVSFL
jgi:hypothetical protein